MKLAIFGASGKTGTEVVKHAVAQGHSVIAFVRTPSKFTIQDPRIQLIQGDVSDLSKVSFAVKGADAVISTLGAKSPFKYDISVTKGIANILQAMHTHHVQRFIYMSFIGVKESRFTAGFMIKHIAPKILSTEIKGHEIREQLVKQSALQWTIVRSSTLTNAKPYKPFRTGEYITAKGFVNTISRTDVAGLLLQLANGNAFSRKATSIMT